MPKSYQIFTKFGLINHGGTKRCQGFYYYYFFFVSWIFLLCRLRSQQGRQIIPYCNFTVYRNQNTKKPCRTLRDRRLLIDTV